MGRPRTFDEDQVIEAARGQFWQTGYHGTSVGDLARATGLGKGSLYGAFGDKHQLFVRIFDEYCRNAERGALAMVDGPEDQALERAHAWLLATASHSDTRGCLLAKGTAELSEGDHEIADRAAATFRALQDACTDLIEQAQRAGDVDPEADARALGGQILATQRGIEALGKGGVDAATLTGIADAAIDGMRLRLAAQLSS
ncbi:MAG TPA: TetR/AcrR family transcriptional regulator [Baekduia sp.]|jgi:AcrR family transcriptional regulator|nr:TetR/AcrR family transcriptional regulator [Baekduia sp.]